MASIYKHRNSWRAEIRRQGHGKLSQSFKTKGKAETWARMVEQQIDAGTYVDSLKADSTIFSTAIDSYLEKRAIMKQGYDIELSACMEFKQQPFAIQKIGRVKPSDIAVYRDAMLNRGLAPGTIKRRFTVLSAVFTYAQSEMDMPALVNPVKQVKLPYVDDARNRIFIGDEEAIFFKSAKRYGKGFLVPVCRFAIETTMRRGEVVGMKREGREHKGLLWSMVDIQDSVLHLTAEITKTGVKRDVPLSPVAIGIIEDMKQYKGADNKVFPVTSDSIRNAFRRAVAHAGIQDFHFHDLRHVGATKWSKVLTQLQLMRLTGHKAPRKIARYYNEEASEIAAIMQRSG